MPVRVYGPAGAAELEGLDVADAPEAIGNKEEPVRAVRWQIRTLQKYLQSNPEMRIVMQRHLAHELSRKVGRLVERHGQRARNDA